MYDIYYRVHVPYRGWLGWAKNGEIAGSIGLALRTEAIQIKLVIKGSQISTEGLSSLTKPTLTYSSHVHMGWKWFPTVAWMCDESFAINVSTKLPDDVDEKWFYFHVSWLNYIFWVVSTLVGGLFGDLLASVDLRGIGFVLPGLFIVIFLEMLFNAKSNNIRGLGAVGAVVALAMLLLTGKSLFMLASMGCMLVVCYIAYKWGGVHLD